MAFTMAQATMCVNDAFDCPLSVRWLFTTRRFSSSALTGIVRTDVAVGTDSDASMFWAIFPAAPRSGVALGDVAGTGTGRGGAGAGAGVGAAGGGERGLRSRSAANWGS